MKMNKTFRTAFVQISFAAGRTLKKLSTIVPENYSNVIETPHSKSLLPVLKTS